MLSHKQTALSLNGGHSNTSHPFGCEKKKKNCEAVWQHLKWSNDKTKRQAVIWPTTMAQQPWKTTGDTSVINTIICLLLSWWVVFQSATGRYHWMWQKVSSGRNFYISQQTKIGTYLFLLGLGLERCRIITTMRSASDKTSDACTVVHIYFCWSSCWAAVVSNIKC